LTFDTVFYNVGVRISALMNIRRSHAVNTWFEVYM